MLVEPIPPDVAAFLESGHLLSLATQGVDGLPTLSPALACEVAEDRQAVIVYLAGPAAGRALADVATNGLVSLLCAMPQGMPNVLLKGNDAALVPAGPAAIATVDHRREAMAAEQLLAGMPTEFSYALGSYAAGTLMAVRFTPRSCQRSGAA